MLPQEKIGAKKRTSAYRSALRQEKVYGMRAEEDETLVFGDDDDEDLRKSLATARKIASKKRVEEEKSGAGVITCNDAASTENPGSGDQPRNRVVFTEMDEFVWGLQLDEGTKGNVFISDQEMKDEDGAKKDDVKKEEKEVVRDETIHEAAVGKGLGGAVKLLKDRGILNEPVELGGRNMDKKKSKLVGIYDNKVIAKKEIRIDRTDEYGRIMTPKEAFRHMSRMFHGKGSGKKKQEKFQREYQQEMKVKQMQNSETPSLLAKRMREAQAKLQTPYIVLSGNVKPGQCR